uniref:NADH-ubiquinone oxidoreductase chain 5 n=1 Tax=Xenophyes cascus TaxID=984453 RepID=L7NB72_9HEMI|nr:NADH dehydrogenase subunit 5 [Xenophyes cascus]
MVFISFYTLVSFILLVVSIMVFLLGLLFFIEMSVVIMEWVLVNFNSTSISFTVILDWMSLVFTSVVCLVSFSVVLYSESYMSGDLYMNRFIILVSLFVLSMVLLILSPNLMGILVGWDGLGLISYCLIIYFQNSYSCRAGMLTALINRLGDAALIIGICWMMNYGCWHYLFYGGSCFSSYIMFFILLASFTSSAQIPFSSWLPAAMAAPTPVSALVHSSTLVTAGIYLIIRFSSGLDLYYSGGFLILSLLTMLMAGVCALIEYDMSSIVALSTLSQLGLMMSSLLVGLSELCFFHLLSHALFKSLMFLCVGAYIHGSGSNQDIRLMGPIVLSSPGVSSCFCISSFSLSAMPFLSGYYSSDLIMEFIAMSNLNLLIFGLFYLSSWLTVIYTFRVVFYSLIVGGAGNPIFFFSEEVEVNVWSMTILGVCSVIGGSGLCWLILGGTPFIVLPYIIKILPLMFIFLGFLIFFEYLGQLEWDVENLGTASSNLIGSMWFLSSLGKWVGQSLLNRSYYLEYCLDSGWFEGLASQGGMFLLSYSTELYSLSYNSVKLFLVWVMVLGCLIVYSN